MKQARTILLTLLSVLVAIPVAYAASVHFKGKNDEPTFRDEGLTLSASGTLAGLGNEDVKIRLVATGDPTATCTNPSGVNQPPGQNPAEVTLAAELNVSADEIKNGNLTFALVTKAPTTPVPGAPDCPSKKWTETITDISFTSATLTVEQGGVIVLEADCTFTPPTDDGTVPAGEVVC